MASLTSSPWILDMAKCFGCIGDRDDYLPSVFHYPLQPVLPLGERNTETLPSNTATPALANQD